MKMTPKWPIYIPSKGRVDVRLTANALESMGVSYYLIAEEHEAAAYSRAIKGRVLTLDPSYQRAYETCDALGLTKSTGPGPARNFAWDHAIDSGAAWHWVMDDNIAGFCRVNNNRRIPCASPAIFRAMEDFCERYDNVLMAGPAYRNFGLAPWCKQAPFWTNSRIYSCNLIRNDAPFRWRGRYNEDTILSLDMLKAGWCTVSFSAFRQNKIRTQIIGGGNTAEFYAVEGTRPKSEMLRDVHPDVTRVVERYGRVHHHVDYSPFRRNRLRRKYGAEIPPGINEYGMILQHHIGGTWIRE